MRKSTRIVKRVLALFLVVLMSINTMGAVVSDNDGSAFITKAEFDSLKNNFQSQIDQYNTSIDSKIDGAIASYLAGISLSKKETPELVSWWNQVRFMDDLMMYGRQAKYTASNTKTVTDLKWHRPNNGNRTVIESGAWSICGACSDTNCTGYVFRLGVTRNVYSGTGVQNGVLGIAGSREWTTIDHQALPATVIQLNKDANGYWTFNDGFKIGSAGNQWWSDAHTPAETSHPFWRIGYFGVGITPGTGANDFVFQSPQNGGLLRYKITGTCTGGQYGGSFNITDELPVSTVGSAVYLLDQPTAAVQTNIEFAALNTESLRTMDYYDSTDALTKDKQNLPYVMLGRSQDWNVLTANIIGRTAYGMYVKDNTNSVQKTLNITAGPINVSWYGGKQTSWAFGQSKTGTINFPIWDEVPANELRNAKYYYREKPLMIGQGIPLGEAISVKGEAKIKIKFEKKNVQTGNNSTDQYVAVKIKKNDFLHSGDWAKGTITNEIGDKRTVEFNDTLYMEAGYEYSLDVDMNKGDQIWLQLSPAYTNSNIYTGDYARLTKLTVEYELENRN